MRFLSLSVNLLAVFAYGPSVIDAFSTGAGGCMAGQAAVGGAHLANPNIVTGTLVQGAFSVAVGDEPFPLSAPLVIGEPYTITVQGPAFRGVLIMSDSSDVSLTPVDNLLQNSIACDALGYPGITHVNSEFKDEVTGEIVCSGAGTQNVGVTVVVANNFQEGSLYYYTGFTIDCGESTAATQAPSETELPTGTDLPVESPIPLPTESPVAADITEATPEPTDLPLPTSAPTVAMTVVTMSPTDNATATDMPTDLNETDVPTLEVSETEAPVGPVGSTETESPTGPVGAAETEPPSVAPVAPEVPTVGADATTPPPSSAPSTTVTLLLSLGAAAALAWSF
jgi:hypothetical protein